MKIPAIKQKFYPDSAVKQIKDKIYNVIRKKYGDIIAKISNITDVNTELIESFIFIESSGDAKAQTPYAVGLMQVSPAMASDTIIKEYRTKKLTKEEENIIKKNIGLDKWSKVQKAKSNSIGTYITRDELFNPEFNILIGAMHIGQLLDEFTEKGIPRLDKIVVIYNTGKYSKLAKKIIADKTSSMEALTNSMPKGQADYVRKLIGINSTLDIIV